MLINSVLLQVFLVSLGVAACLGILAGILMLFRHEQLLRLNQYFSRWMSTDKFGEQFDRPRSTERFFYRHHRLVGAALLFGAMVVLYTFLFSYNLRKISIVITRDNWWWLDAVVGMLLIGSVPAAIVGLIMFSRPSLLRDIENSANRWISTDRLLQWFNGMRYSAEQSILQHRRLAGVTLLFGGLYIMTALGFYFIHW
ncbi:MAG: hypothetical protein HY066_02365 [Betaproteobacteria bacterium]|nr:hypothetical protein [Betaproteobacteria bacterium]